MTTQQKTALVTGAGRGIGNAIVQTLAQRGHRVIVADIDGEAARAVAEGLNNGSIGIQLDVSNPDAVTSAVENVAAEFGDIDVLVNNAGINRDAMLHKMTDAQWDQVIGVDLSGVFYMCRSVGTLMRARGEGRIVNISSASWEGNIGQTNYAAAKAGVVGLTRSIAKELARYSVTVNAICPGFIRTEMTSALPEQIYEAQLAKIPMGWVGEPEHVARAVAFFAGEDAAYVTGQVLAVGGGYQI